MRQLRERVMKLREDHDRIYHLIRTEGKPSINWGNMMDEKLVGSSHRDHCGPDINLCDPLRISQRVPIMSCF